MTPTPPVAKRIESTTTLHGETRVDEYAWLRHREDPAVIAYLEAARVRESRAIMLDAVSWGAT